LKTIDFCNSFADCLTTGVDAFTGTTANDTFNATVASTFTALDSVDGGSGTDTLNVSNNGGAVATAGTTVKNIETANLVSSATVITRLEYGEQGNNPRYVVTNLTDEPQELYDNLYCQRGEAENRIKEAQVGLFATRTSCHPRNGSSLLMNAF
jgi:hypothetical protein